MFAGKRVVVVGSNNSALDIVQDPSDALVVQGYASLFGMPDQSGDVVQPGAYKASLKKRSSDRAPVKMLWQHDPTQPIGVWDQVYEDEKGLFVKGRILKEIQTGREALALVEAGAVDGLSIGYRTVKSKKNNKGGRDLKELDLWEVSLVTFPMLPEARVTPMSNGQLVSELADVIAEARRELLG